MIDESVFGVGECAFEVSAGLELEFVDSTALFGALCPDGSCV